MGVSLNDVSECNMQSVFFSKPTDGLSQTVLTIRPQSVTGFPSVLELARGPRFRVTNRNGTLVPRLRVLVVFKFRERLHPRQVLHILYVPHMFFQSIARLACFLGRNQQITPKTSLNPPDNPQISRRITPVTTMFQISSKKGTHMVRFGGSFASNRVPWCPCSGT